MSIFFWRRSVGHKTRFEHFYQTVWIFFHLVHSMSYDPQTSILCVCISHFEHRIWNMVVQGVALKSRFLLSRALEVIRRYCNQLWIFCGRFSRLQQASARKAWYHRGPVKSRIIASYVHHNFYLWYFIMPQIMFFPCSINITARLACTNNDTCSTDSLARLKIGFNSTK